MDPEASFTVATPVAARAEMSTRTAPLTTAEAGYPSAPTIATDVLAVEVPAMHFPAGPQTGYWFGQEISSTHGICPPAWIGQPAAPSARAARSGRNRFFEVSVIQCLRPPRGLGA